VPWGWRAGAQGRTLGTFNETWQLGWQPELSIRLIEASRYGATVHDAAERLTQERAVAAEELAELTTLVEDALLVGLDGAPPAVMRALADLAAGDADIGRLMDAIGPLARVSRYGNVCGDDTATVGAVLDGLLARVCAGLPSAVGGLDDDAAHELPDASNRSRPAAASRSSSPVRRTPTAARSGSRASCPAAAGCCSTTRRCWP
jgi:hypothetical protein